MARSIKGISVSSGPSAPHLAVFCQLNLDLASMTTQVIVMPRALPPAADPLPDPVPWADIIPVQGLNDEDSISKVLNPWHTRIASDAADLARDFTLCFGKADVHKAQQAQVSDQGRYIGWGRPAIVKLAKLRQQITADVTHEPESAGATDRILTPWHVLYMRIRQGLAMRNKGKKLPNSELGGIFTRMVDSLDKLLTLPSEMTGIPLIEQRVREM